MVNLNSSNTSCLDPTSQVSDYLKSGIVMGLCFAVGLPGNIVVLVVILRRSCRLLNFTMLLMLNLAFSDILCLATLPVWIYTAIHGWTLGFAVCKLATFLLYLSRYANVLTVTLLSIQRYVQVLKPQTWNRLGKKGEGGLLLALWGLACVLTAPAVATCNVNYDKLKCRQHMGSDAERLVVLVLEVIFGFVIPFSVIVTSYCCLHRQVNQTALFSSAKLTRLVTSVVVAFLIFWIPVLIVDIVDIARVILKASRPDVSDVLLCYRTKVVQVLRSLIFIHCCLDPFLYAFASRTIRTNPKPASQMGAIGMQIANI